MWLLTFIIDLYVLYINILEKNGSIVIQLLFKYVMGSYGSITSMLRIRTATTLPQLFAYCANQVCEINTIKSIYHAMDVLSRFLPVPMYPYTLPIVYMSFSMSCQNLKEISQT